MRDEGPARERCVAQTARGSRCKLWPAPGETRCTVHLRSAAGLSRARAGAPPNGPGKGRPDSITEDKIAEFEKLLRAGNYIATACQALGVPRSTFNEWMVKGTREGPEFRQYAVFRERIDTALARGEARLVTLVANAAADDWRAALAMLERTHPERWAKPSQRQHAAAAQPPTAEGQAAGGSTMAELVAAAQRGAPRNQG